MFCNETNLCGKFDMVYIFFTKMVRKITLINFIGEETRSGPSTYENHRTATCHWQTYIKMYGIHGVFSIEKGIHIVNFSYLFRHVIIFSYVKSFILLIVLYPQLFGCQLILVQFLLHIMKKTPKEKKYARQLSWSWKITRYKMNLWWSEKKPVSLLLLIPIVIGPVWLNELDRWIT